MALGVRLTLTICCALALSACAEVSGSSRGVSRGGVTFKRIVPVQPPPGWPQLTTPSGDAILTYPPFFRPVRSDPGSVSVAAGTAPTSMRPISVSRHDRAQNSSTALPHTGSTGLPTRTPTFTRSLPPKTSPSRAPSAHASTTTTTPGSATTITRNSFASYRAGAARTSSSAPPSSPTGTGSPRHSARRWPRSECPEKKLLAILIPLSTSVV